MVKADNASSNGFRGTVLERQHHVPWFVKSGLRDSPTGNDGLGITERWGGPNYLNPEVSDEGTTVGNDLFNGRAGGCPHKF
jgi:hypothetical protein